MTTDSDPFEEGQRAARPCQETSGSSGVLSSSWSWLGPGNSLTSGPAQGAMHGGAYGAYCASPLPNDQFSFFTSTRLMNTSCGRRFKC